MTYLEALNKGTKELNDTISTSPALDAEVLLCSIANFNKANLLDYRNAKMPPKQVNAFEEAIKARKKGMPVAYLTGKKEFFNLSFNVNKNVLIPRPETETLVEKIAFELKGKHGLKILDIGTGSGCIIISLAKTLSNNNQYFASDDSPKALAVAEENARKHKVNVKFFRSDLTRTTGTDYDVIIANLPYLPALEDPSTKFEPKSALVAKKGGLELYERLFEELGKSKSRPAVYLEFGHDQAEQIKELANKFLHNPIIEIFKDMASVPRFARIWQKTAK